MYSRSLSGSRSGGRSESLSGSRRTEKKKYVYWKDEEMWLGYLEEYPDYWTQGSTVKELENNLKDVYKELASGGIPCARKVAELEVS